MAVKVLNKLDRGYPRAKNQILIANGIFDFIDLLVGPEDAPQVTKRLTTLPQQDIRDYLQSFASLRERIRNANAKKRNRANAKNAADKEKADKKDKADAKDEKDDKKDESKKDDSKSEKEEKKSNKKNDNK